MPDHESSTKVTRKSIPLVRRLAYALLPALLLVFIVEGVCRVIEVWSPAIHSAPLHDELAGITVHDEDLFWRVRPGLDAVFQDARIRTNRLGLRNDEIGAKATGEFRILSLGESTTFGDGVENEATYSAVLEEALNQRGNGATCRVLNAGVPSYTSFQSLQYLKTRGAALEPDMVLFYHEFNDFLPASHRTSRNDYIGLSQTDRERHDSTGNWMHRKWMSWSAFYRYLCRRAARRDIERIQNDTETTSGFMFTPEFQRHVFHQEILPGSSAKGVFLTQRVPPKEREIVFRELFSFCRSRGIRLVVIHPSYKSSARHECLVTRMCDWNQVPLFDAHESLHSTDIPPELLFQDHVHPTALGHRRLGEALAKFLLDNQWVKIPSAGKEVEGSR